MDDLKLEALKTIDKLLDNISSSGIESLVINYCDDKGSCTATLLGNPVVCVMMLEEVQKRLSSKTLEELQNEENE